MVMLRCQITSSAHTCLLLFLFGLSSKLAVCNPINPDRQALSDSNVLLPNLSQQPLFPTLGEEKEGPKKEEEEEDELFKDIDPKTLAAVLLEVLNKPQGERNGEEAGELGKEGNTEKEEMEVKREQESRKEEEEDKGEEEQEQQGVDRDRDGREELELVMAAAAAQGREEREREEEEERKRAEEEEERLTEKVTSHTTSHTLPLKPKPAVQEEEVLQKEEPIKFAGGNEEEEQLSPEEVKNLQNMLEEFQSYRTTTEDHSAERTGQRENRGHLADPDSDDYTDNDIRPKGFRGYNLGLSKKKLKWRQQQEAEQLKAKNRPRNRGGNFMDEFNDNPAAEDEEEEEEEVMSPEEEEARAKAEQEEVRRQAAEAQRAKAEEEKLADIASDMLLQYMMKQDGKKAQEQRKKNALGMNAVEDKRSEEEEDVDDDDIDPQTIDKLIEISSKLHLPADDVVDIINDVEKKKKKDAPPETLTWQRPLVPNPAPIPVAPAPRFPTPVKQPLSVSSPFKSWFKDRSVLKPSKQDFWLKAQKQPFRGYPPYPFYQRTYPGYYPIYFPPPKPKPRYYAKPSYAFNTLLGNTLDYDFDFTPKRRYRAWAQPRLRTPPTLQRNLYYPNYIMPHPRTFTAVPMPKARSPVRHRSAFYYPPPASLVTRGQDYYGERRPSEQDSDEELENFIEKVFLKRPQMFQ